MPRNTLDDSPVTTERIAALAQQLLEDNRDLTFAQIGRLTMYAAAWMLGHEDGATEKDIDNLLPIMMRFCGEHAKASLQAKATKGRLQ